MVDQLIVHDIKKPSSCIRLKSLLKLLNDFTEVFIPQDIIQFFIIMKIFYKNNRHKKNEYNSY